MSRKSFIPPCHVHEIPVLLRPLLLIFGYSIAIMGYIYCCFVHFTSRIIIKGQENLHQNTNYILCFWHQFVFLYFVVFLKNRKHVWMQHPVWFMKPSHIFLRMIGIGKIILGSTGYSGKDASNELVHYLRNGYSTAIMPDGPHGPPFVMKKGILHMSKQSGVPIVPMRFDISPSIELQHWDKRKWPVPFSKIFVEYGQPLTVNGDDFESMIQLISEKLT